MGVIPSTIFNLVFLNDKEIIIKLNWLSSSFSLFIQQFINFIFIDLEIIDIEMILIFFQIFVLLIQS